MIDLANNGIISSHFCEAWLRFLQLKDMQRVVQCAVDYKCPCSWWCVLLARYTIFGSFFIHIMTIHTTLHKLPVSLSQSRWSSIVDTRSGPSLLVPSPLDGVLYAEAGWPAYWKFRHRVIRKIAANQFCGSASSGS